MKTSAKLNTVSVTLILTWVMAIGTVLMLVGRLRAQHVLQAAPIDAKVVAPAEQLGRAFAMVATHVKPCVVSVYSEKTIKVTQPDFSFPFGDDFFRQFFGNQLPAPQQRQFRQREYRGQQRGMGSGMILDKEGHILTNYHVVRDVDEINVRLADDRKFDAEIVGTDPKTDVAIIRIKGHVPDDLPTITLGDSDALQVGNLVLAIGAPFTLAQTVTHGIISATGRSDVGIADYEDFLQTDAPINPGNLGGPLVNMRGEVIGMNTAIATGVGQFAGVGFSIPSDMIKSMLPKLLKGEKIVRGQLGVVIQNVTPDLAKQFKLNGSKGALVSQVNKDSAAEKAGIKVGDVITKYDDHPVQNVRDLRNLVASTIPGSQVKIEVIRDSREETFSAIIDKQSEEAMAAATPSEGGATALSKLGLSVQTLTPDLAKQLGVEVEKGAAITDVNEGSLASMAGLQKGDVIVEADHQSVASANELEQVLAKSRDKDGVLLLVKRQGESLFIIMQIK